MKMRAIFVVVGLLASSAWSVDVLWAGLTLEKVPTFEQEFDRLLRENLQVNPDVQMIDNEAASRLRQKINFDEFSAISKRLVEKVMHYIPDSTVIVWGRITDYSLTPHRSGFLWMGADIEGTLTMALNIYSLRFQRYAYAGDITCKAVIPKGVIWFYPLDVAVDISAEDRAQVMNTLQHDAARTCARMVSALIRSEAFRQEKVSEIQGLKRVEEPSVDDLFKIPAGEAKAIGTPADSTKKIDSTAAASASVTDTTKAAVVDTTKPAAADTTKPTPTPTKSGKTTPAKKK